MTKEQSKAARAVMKAWENGEEIQFKQIGEDDTEWDVVPNPSFQFDIYEYRVRPKEKIVYLNIYQDDKIGLCASVHHDKDDAIKMSGVPHFTKQLAIAAPISVVL